MVKIYVDSDWVPGDERSDDGRRDEGWAACGANVLVDTFDDSNLERRGGVDSDGGWSFSRVVDAYSDDGVGLRMWPQTRAWQNPARPREALATRGTQM